MTDGGKFTKKMENKKITYEQFCDPSFRRAEQMKVKSEAVWVVFHELDGLINVSKMAKEYFHKSQAWFAQKLYGHTVSGKERSFTEQEYEQIAATLRSIGHRLLEYANEIDTADNL